MLNFHGSTVFQLNMLFALHLVFSQYEHSILTNHDAKSKVVSRLILPINCFFFTFQTVVTGSGLTLRAGGTITQSAELGALK